MADNGIQRARLAWVGAGGRAGVTGGRWERRE